MLPTLTGAWKTVGGGLDIRVLNGVTLSGNMERISAPGSINPYATRLGGGVGRHVERGELLRGLLGAALQRVRGDHTVEETGGDGFGGAEHFCVSLARDFHSQCNGRNVSFQSLPMILALNP